MHFYSVPQSQSRQHRADPHNNISTYYLLLFYKTNYWHSVDIHGLITWSGLEVVLCNVCTCNIFFKRLSSRDMMSKTGFRIDCVIMLTTLKTRRSWDHSRLQQNPKSLRDGSYQRTVGRVKRSRFERLTLKL